MNNNNMLYESEEFKIRLASNTRFIIGTRGGLIAFNIAGHVKSDVRHRCRINYLRMILRMALMSSGYGCGSGCGGGLRMM